MSFILSPFQKKAVEGIQDNKHVLITAHTGSGKTLPAEHAINFFTKKGKKVIYTSPIKALSNQKFSDFSKKFNTIEVGILTGDNKHNPEADLLIMTTEILQNQLFRLNSKESLKSHLDFSMDIENDLACVIFDEVHYINDNDRGTIWEQTMMLLPNHVQFVMLSATIGNPEYLTHWISDIKDRETIICGTNERIVPLVFYTYYTCSDKSINELKDKSHKKLLYSKCNELHKIENNVLQETNQCMNILKNIHIHRKYVINELCKKMRENEMFPALFFVFSRKQVEAISKEITFPLFEENEKDYNIRPICRQLIVSRVKNWKEYISLPEYEDYVKLLEKGIAIHHAGMLPIFREMIEILYEKKYIKVLIATETFAIGLNMPTKTVCFTSVHKHDGNEFRLLYNNEFKQMAGRAGRRNIDTIGHVILMNNLFKENIVSDMKELLSTRENMIKSKFKINYSMILHYFSKYSLEEFISFGEKSLMYSDIKKESNHAENNIEMVNKKIDTLKENIDISIFEKCKEYNNIKEKINYSSNKQKKEYNKKIRDLEFNHSILDHMETFYEYNTLIKQKKNEQDYKLYADTFISHKIHTFISILKGNNFINDNTLTKKGIIACMVHEIHPLVFSDLYVNTNGFFNIETKELFSILSCFYELKSEEKVPPENVLKIIKESMNYYKDYEIKYELSSINQYEFQYSMYHYVGEWFDNCNNEEECLKFIQRFKEETNMFLGDLVKCFFKLLHICDECSNICEYMNNYDLLKKLKEGKHKIMKFIITNESLYL